MNKQELVKKIAEKADLTQKEAADAVAAFLESVEECLGSGGKLTLVGFGTFLSKQRKGRLVKNPQNGEVIEIPTKTVPQFRPGKALKDAVGA